MSTHSESPIAPSSRTRGYQRLSLLALTILLGISAFFFPPSGQSTSPIGRSLHPAAMLQGVTVSAHAPDQGYWRTEGGRIVDVRGATRRITGTNWSGLETTAMVPGGLKSKDYHAILRTVRAAGYNTIRLPFSNQMVESPIIPAELRFFDEQGAPINGDLKDLDAMQILDRIVQAAGELDLKVILDDHRSEAGSSAEENGLWYTPEYPETAWISDWTFLASHFKDNSTVIGFDLRNEPHNASHGGACWSCGGPTDWHLAAQRAGNAILRVNPHLLIFIEGTDQVGSDFDFWGGNLEGVRTAPVRLSLPNRLVYSAHVYGPAEYPQVWFNKATSPASLAALYHRHWGFISESNMAPVWIGEFGTPNRDTDIASSQPGAQGQWFQALVAYLAAHPDIGWSYWGINGEDRYGLLDPFYAAPANQLKVKALASIASTRDLNPAIGSVQHPPLHAQPARETAPSAAAESIAPPDPPFSRGKRNARSATCRQGGVPPTGSLERHGGGFRCRRADPSGYRAGLEVPAPRILLATTRQPEARLLISDRPVWPVASCSPSPAHFFLLRALRLLHRCRRLQ